VIENSIRLSSRDGQSSIETPMKASPGAKSAAVTEKKLNSALLSEQTTPASDDLKEWSDKTGSSTRISDSIQGSSTATLNAQKETTEDVETSEDVSPGETTISNEDVKSFSTLELGRDKHNGASTGSVPSYQTESHIWNALCGIGRMLKKQR